MAKTQITLVQIDNYRTWTTTPEPRDEADLQMLQAQLYADLVQLIGSQSGYLFFTRFDNMIGLTNGLDLVDHARIQDSIGNRYPISISLSVATAQTPKDALTMATTGLQKTGSAEDGSRGSVLQGKVLDTDEANSDDVEIAHFDLIDTTPQYTTELDAFDAFLRIMRGYLSLTEYLYENHAALTFFIGGDHMITTGPDLGKTVYLRTINHVEESVGIPLQAGIGQGATPKRAGLAAKHALEICRENDTRVEEARANCSVTACE